MLGSPRLHVSEFGRRRRATERGQQVRHAFRGKAVQGNALRVPLARQPFERLGKRSSHFQLHVAVRAHCRDRHLVQMLRDVFQQ